MCLLLMQKAFEIGIVAVEPSRDLSCMSLEALHPRGLVHVQRIIAGLLDQHGVAMQPISLTHFMAQPDILPIDILSKCYLLSTKVGRRSLIETISVASFAMSLTRTIESLLSSESCRPFINLLNQRRPA